VGTAVQLSGRDEAGRPLLCVLAKRTYRFDPDGECALHPDQAPLLREPRYAPGGLLLEEDTDLWPYKPRTDLVVLGHAYNHPGARRFSASVSVGRTTKEVAVFGARCCQVARDGRILFSPPAVAERVPLSYAFAYGGRDALAEASCGNPAALLQPYLASGTEAALVTAASPFLYPRNPAGRGFLVEATRTAVEALELPNLEDPQDLLVPERLAAGEVGRWPLQPVPASLGWLDYGAFPRAAWLGALAACDPIVDPGRVGEVRFGHCQPDILVEKDPPAAPAFEGVNGASLGLRLPHLSGGETIVLLNLSPRRGTLRLHLPSHRPKLSVDGRTGNLLPTVPVIHSVVIQPDTSTLSVVWRGSSPARRPYLREELTAMPFAVEW